MPEKLHQNRVVVLGKDYNDARLHAERHPALAFAEEIVLVSADAHRLTILGSTGGMHVAEVFVTPGAHRGERYDLARTTLHACVERAGGKFTHLDGEGGTYRGL